MEILVCLKQVPDDLIRVPWDAETQKPATGQIEPVINAFDTYALEMAARYKEAHGGRITVCAVGPQSWEHSLKNCLAVGADAAILFCQPDAEAWQCHVFSEYFAKAIRHMETENGQPFEMIFCGRESTDTGYGQVAAMLAQNLDMEMVCDVIAVDAAEKGVLVRKDTENGYQALEITKPSVLAVIHPGYEPRLPTIKNKIAARKAKIPTYTQPEFAGCLEDCCINRLGFTHPEIQRTCTKLTGEDHEALIKQAMAIMTENHAIPE